MCTDCGCGITDGNRHLVAYDHEHRQAHPYHRHGHGAVNSLTAHNDLHARANRALFDRHGVLVINLMSSPGSGKTSLLEATIRALKGALRIAVIEGDLETENDADRIRALGVPAYQITTGTACHLDAHLVEHALAHLDLANLDILFIENVGNLICPASFDLGHHRNVILLSVTEGDDKPAKYPVMFRAADLMLLSKTDLLPYLAEFSPQKAEASLRNLASPAPVLHVSAKDGTGLEAWVDWLRATREEHRQSLDAGTTLLPGEHTDTHRTRDAAAPEIHFVAPSR
jgi:hydrogenase nickel incorporation protein HypB